MVTPAVALSVDMSDLSSDRGPSGHVTRGEISPGQVSVSYAWSEIIVEIIDIAEKCWSGFFLITQVTAVF
jgi:hypothetical protein